MKTLDRPAVKLIADDIMEALKAVAAKHNIVFSYKGGNFTASNCTYKVEAAVVGESGAVASREYEQYKQYCNMYNLKPEWLDQTFKLAGDTFTIIGLNPRKHKNPVLCKKASNGKTYIFTPDDVRLRMQSSVDA